MCRIIQFALLSYHRYSLCRNDQVSLDQICSRRGERSSSSYKHIVLGQPFVLDLLINLCLFSRQIAGSWPKSWTWTTRTAPTTSGPPPWTPLDLDRECYHRQVNCQLYYRLLTNPPLCQPSIDHLLKSFTLSCVCRYSPWCSRRSLGTPSSPWSGVGQGQYLFIPVFSLSVTLRVKYMSICSQQSILLSLTD